MHNYIYGQLSEALGIKAPLLMLDRLCIDTEARTASGIKCISVNEVIFQGHFPGQPVTPGVLQVAAMEQISMMLFDELFPGEGMPVTVAFRRVKFRTPVLPGMILHVQCSIRKEQEDGKVEFFIENRLGENGNVTSSGFVTLQRKNAACLQLEHGEGKSPILPDKAERSEMLGSRQIMEILPHRYPFILIDGVFNLAIDKAIGFKNVTGNDPLVNAFRHANFPGFLQLEAGLQLGFAALLVNPENKGTLGYLISIDSADFFRPVLPGEQLAIRIRIESDDKFGIANGEFYVEDMLVSKAGIKFALITAELYRVAGA